MCLSPRRDFSDGDQKNYHNHQLVSKISKIARLLTLLFLDLGLRAPSQLLQAATPAAATQILVDRQLAFGTVVVGRGYGDARSRWRSHSLSGKRFTGAIGTARRAWVRSAPHGQWRQPRVCAVYGGLKVLNNQLVAYLVA